MTLPVPVGRQREVLYLPATGHFVVLGTAGSGKTTLAILRAAYLAHPSTDHGGKTLLITFNRALVAYLRHLQDRDLAGVVVENYHKFARGYLKSRGKMGHGEILDDTAEREALIHQAVSNMAQSRGKHPVFDWPVRRLSEEFRWIAGHGLTNAEAYVNIERVGRSQTRVTREHRPVVFDIYQAYRKLWQSSGKRYDWDSMASAVCEEMAHDPSPRRYRHVVIDEGQDFSPEMIRSLASCIPPDGSLTLFGDVAQQIYGRRLTWRSAGLRVDRAWEFKENYRNSRQIAKLGLAISRMPYFRDTPDIVEPISPVADGPLPTLVHCSDQKQEVELVVSQATVASRTQSVAVLFRSRDDERLVAPRLPKTSVRLHRNMTTWQAGPGVRFGTYHSAKGLEFDMVILPFLGRRRLPDPDAVAALGEDEASAGDGKLLYVGVTRAKTRLVMTSTDEVTRLLPQEPGLYQEVNR